MFIECELGCYTPVGMMFADRGFEGSVPLMLHAYLSGTTPKTSPGKHDQRQGRSITQLLTDEFGVPFVLGQLELAIIQKLLVCACGFCKSLCVRSNWGIWSPLVYRY